MDNRHNPVVVYIPNDVKAKRIETREMANIDQYCRTLGLND